jgi:hypothetical protein
MSFTGDLEHLSIVDVVQLLHSTRKSGTLTVKSGKGECQLVFDDGFIISANHFDNSLRIGRILVEAKVITEEALSQTLKEQAAAGKGRKPLVAALIEGGKVKKQDAYRGLETLLELTIVEVLTWQSGTFTLDVGKVTADADYRYFPEKLHERIQFHTENVLMDALRIYDEKKRDGSLAEFELTEDLLVEEPGPEAAGPARPAGDAAAGGGALISADDLGLGDVERLERRIPGVFTPLEDRAANPHRRALEQLAPALPEADRERLVALLDGLAPHPRPAEAGAPFVVLFGADELLAHCLSTACRHAGLGIFSTSEERDIDPVLEQCRARGGLPVLLLDAPAGADPRFSAATLADLRRRKLGQHPHLSAIHLVVPGAAPLPADVPGGVLAVLQRPRPDARGEALAEGLAAFLKAFPAAVRTHVRGQGAWYASRIAPGLASLAQAPDPGAVTLALLHAVLGVCQRAIILIVRGRELVADRGVGFAPGREPQPLAAPAPRIPLPGSALLAGVVDEGRSRCGQLADPGLEALLARVAPPRSREVLLVPLRAAGRTVALVYGDFGRWDAEPVDADLLEILSGQAGLALDGILHRRKSGVSAP